MAYWVIGLPLGYFLAFRMGYEAVGIWIGLFLGLSMSAFLNSLRFEILSRKKLVA
jgi:MATE family multidrug resistance protein